MKASIAGFAFILSAVAYADPCTDFSGTYLWNGTDTDVVLTLAQSHCESLDAHFGSAIDPTISDKMTLDGQKHVVIDSSWLRVIESSRWQDGKILIEGENAWLEQGKVTTYKKSLYFNPQNELVSKVRYFNENGKPSASSLHIYKRY